jgi:hypothetical protein
MRRWRRRERHRRPIASVLYAFRPLAIDGTPIQAGIRPRVARIAGDDGRRMNVDVVANSAAP